MAEDQFTTIRLAPEEKWLVVTCLEPVIEISNGTFKWGDELDQVLELLNGRGLILDFSNVEIFASSGLQYLIKLLMLFRSGKIRFGLCNLNDGILEDFDITRLWDKFVIGKEVEDVKKILEADV